MANSIAIGVAYQDQAISGGTIDNSVIGGVTPAAITCTSFVATGNCRVGDAATDTICFYGATPAAQRANAIQAASVVSVSSYITVGSNLAAWAAEVNATLTGLGLWKGAA